MISLSMLFVCVFLTSSFELFEKVINSSLIIIEQLGMPEDRS